MFVPQRFKKDLEILDPTYRIQDTEDHEGYYIVKDVDLTLRSDGGKSLSIPGGDPKWLRVRGPLVVLFIPTHEFGEQILEKLREMKREALAMGIYDNPTNELAWLQKKKKEARQKKAELATEMISEGLMEAHRLERKKSFSYGGS